MPRCSQILHAILFGTAAFGSGALVAVGSAAAQQCNPRDFTIQDIERTDISDMVRIASRTLVVEDSSESSNTSFGASLPVEGVPVSISASDATAFSKHLLKESEYNFSRDLTASFLRTQLSGVGATMYRDCLAARNISISFPATAFSEKDFFLTIRWTPQSDRAPEKGHYVVKAIGGMVDGKNIAEGDVRKFTDVPLAISKSGSQVTQVIVSIDDQAHPALLFPPPAVLKKFTLVQRRGRSQVPHDSAGFQCNETAYLVSEVGSVAGNSAKSCTLCASASPGGVLLKDTAKVNAALSSRGAGAEVQQTSTSLEACGYFYTHGAGQGSGRFEVYQGAYFTVWEAVPVAD